MYSSIKANVIIFQPSSTKPHLPTAQCSWCTVYVRSWLASLPSSYTMLTRGSACPLENDNDANILEISKSHKEDVSWCNKYYLVFLVQYCTVIIIFTIEIHRCQWRIRFPFVYLVKNQFKLWSGVSLGGLSNAGEIECKIWLSVDCWPLE